jgi:hypothetical protein
MFNTTTTLYEIRSIQPCAPGWKTALTYLQKSSYDEHPLTLRTILESNGLEDVIYVMSVPSLIGIHNATKAFCVAYVRHYYEGYDISDVENLPKYAKQAIKTAEKTSAWQAYRSAIKTIESAQHDSKTFKRVVSLFVEKMI